MERKYYTGTGDLGDTGFFGTADRVPKSSQRVEALGAVDELNSWLGLCRARSVAEVSPREGGLSSAPTKILEQVQQSLFIIQAELAGADEHLTESHLKNIEEHIAEISKHVPGVVSFVLAGASEMSALYDVVRTVVRRAERRVVALAKDQQMMGAVQGRPRDHTLAYMNRLSSLMYVLARQEAAKSGIVEKSPEYT